MTWVPSPDSQSLLPSTVLGRVRGQTASVGEVDNEIELHAVLGHACLAALYFPNESRRLIVRLNTSLPGRDSTLSAQK